jgi:GDP-L-fucose synthase|tara:strand:- start:11549 stop:11686 length:138 start_codon:yes stop_codon:yes gene_type:complete
MSKIFVAGHSGMVGRAIMRQLAEHGDHQIVTRTHEELNLTAQPAA